MPDTQTPQEFSRALPERLAPSEKWAFAWMPTSGITVYLGAAAPGIRKSLSQKSLHSFVVDANHSSLRESASEREAVWNIVGAPSKLPFLAGSVDTVILLDILSRVRDERKVVDEVQRVLRPGGKFILSVPNRGMFRFAPRDRSDGPGVRPNRLYSEADLTRLLFLKFRVLRQHYGGLLLLPLQRKWSKDIMGSRLLKNLVELDYAVSWGRWSYEVILLAEKI